MLVLSEEIQLVFGNHFVFNGSVHNCHYVISSRSLVNAPLALVILVLSLQPMYCAHDKVTLI